MGLFVNVNESVGPEMDYEQFIECHEENMLEAGATILIEAEQNWNAIMKAVGVEEVKAYVEGVEAVTEAGRVAGMLEKAKQFFKNLWQKVVGMFKKMLSILDQQASKDKAFVKKYRTEVAKKMGMKDWNEGLTMDLYPFAGIGGNTAAAHGKLKSGLNSAGISIDGDNLGTVAATVADLDWKDEIGDKVRGMVIGTSGETESEFRKELKDKIYGEKDTAADITQDIVLKAMSTIEGSEKAKKDLKDAFKPLDESLKKVIKNTEKAQSKEKFQDKDGKGLEGEALTSATKQYNAVAVALDVVKTAQTVLTSVYSMELQAIKDQNRQSRAIVGKVFRKSVKEAGFEHFEEGTTYGNAFDSVVLV